MTQIATHQLDLTGAAPSYGAAASGDTAATGDGLALVVKNGSGSTITFTAAVPGKQIGGADNDDVTVSVVAGAEGWLPLESIFADPADGLAHITWSSTTTVTRAVIRR